MANKQKVTFLTYEHEGTTGKPYWEVYYVDEENVEMGFLSDILGTKKEAEDYAKELNKTVKNLSYKQFEEFDDY